MGTHGSNPRLDSPRSALRTLRPAQGSARPSWLTMSDSEGIAAAGSVPSLTLSREALRGQRMAECGRLLRYRMRAAASAGHGLLQGARRMNKPRKQRGKSEVDRHAH